MTPKHILIYLREKQTSWLVIDEAGQLIEMVLDGNLTDLTPKTAGCTIDVIVPGESVLLTTAELPKLNKERLKQALPFALEEQLIDDVTLLHFVTGGYQEESGRFPVAVVAKEKMDHWLSELKNAMITPRTLIPSITALPFTADAIYVCIENDIAIVRTGHYSGFTCDKENLHTLLTSQLTETGSQITDIHVYNFSNTAITLSFANLSFHEIVLNQDQLLEYLLQWTSAYPSINLLQGNYQVTQKATPTKKIWIVAACLAITWVGFSLLSSMGSFFLLHHATTLSDQEIEKIYKHNFPQASSVIAPRQRMEEKLKKLSINGAKNNLLMMLAIVGNNLPKAKGIQLLNLEYHGNQLTLNISASTFENLDAFTQSLVHQNLSVKQQNAAISGKEVKANVLITQGAL